MLFFRLVVLHKRYNHRVGGQSGFAFKQVIGDRNSAKQCLYKQDSCQERIMGGMGVTFCLF